MKNCSKNKFLDCFRPSEIDLDDQTIDCITVSNMISKSSVSEKKTSFRRSFSAVFKPTVVQTNLGKKDRDIQRSKSYCHLNSKFDESAARPPVQEHGSESPTSTLCFGPTRDSSFGSCDLRDTHNLGSCVEDDEKVIKDFQEEKGMSRKSRSEDLMLNHVMYLVLLSLLVTVLWGKSLAVVITTVSIFFVRISSEGKCLENLCVSLGF